jgi:hypothetical protein
MGSLLQTKLPDANQEFGHDIQDEIMADSLKGTAVFTTNLVWRA